MPDRTPGRSGRIVVPYCAKHPKLSVTLDALERAGGGAGRDPRLPARHPRPIAAGAIGIRDRYHRDALAAVEWVMDGEIREAIRVDRGVFYAAVEQRADHRRHRDAAEAANGDVELNRRSSRGGTLARTKWARPVAMVVAALLSSCAQPDRGRCLASHLEKHYHPTDVFLGGIAGYTHEYFPSDDPVCDQWEYPDGRPAASAHPD